MNRRRFVISVAGTLLAATSSAAPRPRIAIIIDDLGYQFAAGRRALELAEELQGWEDAQAERWSQNLRPLTQLLRKRYLDFLGSGSAKPPVELLRDGAVRRIVLARPEDLEVVGASNGGLDAQDAGALVVHLDRVATNPVLDANALGAVLELVMISPVKLPEVSVPVIVTSGVSA